MYKLHKSYEIKLHKILQSLSFFVKQSNQPWHTLPGVLLHFTPIYNVIAMRKESNLQWKGTTS